MRERLSSYSIKLTEWREVPALRCRSGYDFLAGTLDERSNRFGGLRTAFQPVVDAVEGDFQRFGLALSGRIVGTDDFDKATVATSRALANNEAIVRSVSSPMTLQSDSKHCVSVLVDVLKLKVLYEALVSGKCQAVLFALFPGRGFRRFLFAKLRGRE